MLFSNLEYILLRLVRRFLIPRRLITHWGRFLPYYRVNLGEEKPESIVATYSSILNQRHESLAGKSVLEIGSGATNATGYLMVTRGCSAYWGLEPYWRYQQKLDNNFLKKIGSDPQKSPDTLALAVQRISSMKQIADHSIDLIVSKSVLEHVLDLPVLFNELKRVLKPKGYMIHLVDYRDHFFKYPFHFLQFSDAVWDLFLNPGDLPRYRVDSHVNAFKKAGFAVELLNVEYDEQAFQKIRESISPCFAGRDPKLIAVTQAVILVNNPED